ncbi:hypothetical protein Z517_09271 [Fonsecaea pedrosoi CBS 271.37]|uniref:Uncharacterized protein n=1 Tax=Fonsecaea pedrosoi CBS 271.37 TaxID=1442368 RepID=A0A0D2ERE4_9EURO|nr:uncharacterized protein Z517_09271 [Fonsecaea pedrosoi CBS 271.37]KIW76827.1 hypothetical protein Z517_09271 [Fonsecaea pedrosoi CBS 271.37]
MPFSQDTAQVASPAGSLTPTEPAISFTARAAPDEPETASPEPRWSPAASLAPTELAISFAASTEPDEPETASPEPTASPELRWSPAASLAPTEPAISFAGPAVPDEPEAPSPELRWILHFIYSWKGEMKSVDCYVCEGPKIPLKQSEALSTPALIIFSNAHVLFTEPSPNDAFRETLFLTSKTLRDFSKDSWGAVKPDNINISLCSVGTLLGVKTYKRTRAIRRAARKITKGCMDISDDDGEWDCTAEAKDLCECKDCLGRYGRPTGAGSKRELAIDDEERDRIENRTVTFTLNVSSPFIASSINPASLPEISEEDQQPSSEDGDEDDEDQCVIEETDEKGPSAFQPEGNETDTSADQASSGGEEEQEGEDDDEVKEISPGVASRFTREVSVANPGGLLGDIVVERKKLRRNQEYSLRNYT